MRTYQRSVDYCKDDSIQVIPKFNRDYLPEGFDPLTMKPLVVSEGKDTHDLGVKKKREEKKEI